MKKSEMNIGVKAAITSRRSIRQFTSKPISNEVITDILEVAAWAPSGTNIQPWNVHVLTGSMKGKVCETASKSFLNPTTNNKNDRLHYMEKFRDPYISRRRKVGWDLYTLLDIKKGDYEKTKSFHVKNFSFFGAPVGLIFTIEKDLGWMSWLDYGMFLQNICIAARAYGLHTCAQASWSGVHEDIAPLLKISTNHLIHCGMSIGMEDEQAVVNKLRTERADLDDFVTFHE